MSQELAALVRRHVEAENAQNLEATLATLHPECRFEDHATLGEATWRGHHVGPFLGIAPTKRPVIIPFVVVLGFRDGLMQSEGFHYDLASLLRQIGSEPIPALSGMTYRTAA
ncbi:MAG: ester cyclase [Rhodospirillales bacterium]|nr:ester cyclase [Rhodospirillales bacterium]